MIIIIFKKCKKRGYNVRYYNNIFVINYINSISINLYLSIFNNIYKIHSFKNYFIPLGRYLAKISMAS